PHIVRRNQVGSVGKTDAESTFFLNVFCRFVAGTQAKYHLVNVIQPTPSSVHSVGSAIFIIGSNDKNRQRIKPGFASKIFTHNKYSLISYILSIFVHRQEAPFLHNGPTVPVY